MMNTDALRVRVQTDPNVAIYPPGATFGPRELRDWEFVWLLEGEARYTWNALDDAPKTPPQAVELRTGDLLLCQAGTRDGFLWSTGTRTRHGFFHFQIVAGEAELPPPAEWPRVLPLSDDSLLASLARHLLTWSGRESLAQRDLTAALFLGTFLNGQTQLGDAPPQKMPEPVERAVQFLYKQLESDAGAPFSLEQMARAAFVTPEHLCRLFRASLGHSPLETVRLARLDKAAILLARSNYPVAEIGRMHGFSSPFHFSRAFKDAYGVSPRELRNRLERGEAFPTPRLLQTLKPQL